MKPRISIPMDEIRDYCRRWKLAEFALFGSVLRDDFGPDSDVDVLVRFASGAEFGLFDLVTMEDELAEIVGRPVDLVTRAAVERSRNHLRRKAILDDAEVIYAA